jgi:uncharacterized phage protein (TIGR02216 family)
MQHALGVLHMSPQNFWMMTPRELALTLPRRQVVSLPRDRLHELMAEFPDPDPI